MDSSQIYLVFILGTLILVIFALSLIAFLIHYKRKQQLHITEKLNLKHQFETQLLTTRLEVQEQAFQYFSEEIHDNIGQQLTFCKLLMHQIQERNDDKEDSEMISQATDLITTSLSDLRSISHTLNGNFIARAGLIDGLEREVKYISSVRKAVAYLEVDGEPVSLSQEKELLVFRIVQEAVANALKHAHPKTIRICLHYNKKYLTVNIIDDGNGFEKDNKQGTGLINIHQRAKMLGGVADILSAPEKGTTITIKIAISDEH